MRNKLILTVFSIQLLFFCFADITLSQTESSVMFPNGITVSHMTENENNFSSGGTYDFKKGVLFQFFFDENTKTYFGYDLHVVPLANTSKFKLTFKPLTGKPHKSWKTGIGFRKIPLPSLPREITVNDGDIVSLDLMENLKTKEKIKEYIVVTRRASVGPRFARRHIPKDFTLDDVNIKFDRYKIKVNGKTLYQTSGGGSGGNVAIYMPGKGRFIFSPFRRKGYDFKKIGLITNNKLQFRFGGDDYEIISESALLGEGGKWNVWVKAEPYYVPSKDSYFSVNKVFMQSGSVEYIFSKQK